jgi:hypothetical protein
MMICACGCSENTAAGDYRDAAAADLAVASMVETANPLPAPEKCDRCDGSGWIEHGDGHRTPCPQCQGSAGDEYSGPLDTIRDAKELIRQANRAVERGNAILDAVERDGKVTVDVRLPGRAVQNFETRKSYCDNSTGYCLSTPLGESCDLYPGLAKTCIAPDSSCDSGPLRRNCTHRNADIEEDNAAETDDSCPSCREGIFRRPRLFWRWRR